MCENNIGLADIELREVNAGASLDKQDQVSSRKRKRNIDYLRAKRLRRNKRKKEVHRNRTRQERFTRIAQRLTKNETQRGKILKMKLEKVVLNYKKERRLSAFCWGKYKEQLALRKTTSSIPRHLNRSILKSSQSSQTDLGEGCFGKCIKMDYRGITVAVKQLKKHTSESAVKREASILSQLDHPGLPLFFGLCYKQSPFIIVTQFYGIDGQCMTINRAVRTTYLDEMSECARLFHETAQALEFLHQKKLLHNDIKGDNVVLTDYNGLHSILIDFGKARKVSEAKQYALSKEEKQLYKSHHWHIAPELIDGTHKQSFASDIYSFGVMLKHVCKQKKFRMLLEIGKESTHSNPSFRPKIRTICDKLSKYEN